MLEVRVTKLLSIDEYVYIQSVTIRTIITSVRNNINKSSIFNDI